MVVVVVVGDAENLNNDMKRKGWNVSERVCKCEEKRYMWGKQRACKLLRGEQT